MNLAEGIFVSCWFNGVLMLLCFIENCPDQNPRLRNWDPGQDSAKQVVIKEGDMFRLTSDATVNSIVIQDGGEEPPLSMGTATFDVLYVENYCWHLECGVTLNCGDRKDS